MTAPAFIDDLRAIVGAAHVLVDDDVRAPYETDWTRRYSGTAAAIVRPDDTAEVAAVLRACGAHGVAVVPQGGNTGLVGGGVPRRGEVVVSLSRLTSLGQIDAASLQVDAGAGVTLGALQAHAAAVGLDAALDFAARDTATLGGIVACDAGGLQAVRHGTARARVAGLEVVLADGSVVDRMSGLLKDNAGYDLPALVVGSEGTLGIVTRVRWRLTPALPSRALALVAFASVADAVDAVGALRTRLSSLEVLELMTAPGMELTAEHLGVPNPLPGAAAYVLVGAATAAGVDPLPDLADTLERSGLDETALIADDAPARTRLMRLREAHTEAIAAAGVPHKLDVGVPLARLAGFITALDTVVAPPARTYVFGHLGDGNLHVNVLGPAADDTTVDTAVLELVAAHGGTISAEHGVGVAKAPYLHFTRSAAELAAMRAIKRALDPTGTLNPGAVLEQT